MHDIKRNVIFGFLVPFLGCTDLPSINDPDVGVGILDR
jgi:hypothetical protein